MKLKLTVDECLALADEWSQGITIHEDSQGWRVVCMVLAEEVRRQRDCSSPTFRETKMWLLGREADIAVGLEDLGELRALFVSLFGREPHE